MPDGFGVVIGRIDWGGACLGDDGVDENSWTRNGLED